MRVDRPILYHFSGACEGGEVVFSLPPVALRYVLAPPLCRPISSNAAMMRTAGWGSVFAAESATKTMTATEAT